MELEPEDSLGICFALIIEEKKKERNSRENLRILKWTPFLLSVSPRNREMFPFLFIKDKEK